MSAALVAFSAIASAQDAEQTLAAVVQQQKKALPLIMDAESTVDDITYADRKLEYTITLPGYQGRPGEQGYYQAFVHQQIMGTLCKQTAYLLVLALGNQISYRYIDSKGGPIAVVTLNDQSCSSNS